MDNPPPTIVGRPTGRLINHHPPCAIDLERVIRVIPRRRSPAALVGYITRRR